jgi:hypothetical protein
MKQAHRHKPLAAEAHKKLHKRVARAAKPQKVERRFAAPIFKTGLAGSVLKYERPFDPVWPTEEN